MASKFFRRIPLFWLCAPNNVYEQIAPAEDEVVVELGSTLFAHSGRSAYAYDGNVGDGSFFTLDAEGHLRPALDILPLLFDLKWQCHRDLCKRVPRALLRCSDVVLQNVERHYVSYCDTSVVTRNAHVGDDDKLSLVRCIVSILYASNYKRELAMSTKVHENVQDMAAFLSGSQWTQLSYLLKHFPYYDYEDEAQLPAEGCLLATVRDCVRACQQSMCAASKGV
jgi:hypothetical protein